MCYNKNFSLLAGRGKRVTGVNQVSQNNPAEMV